MNVSDLQQILAALGPLLEPFGVKGTSLADLKTIRDGLAPFSQLSLKDFASFLGRAHAYSRGEVPIKPPRGGGSGAKPTARTAVDVSAIAMEVRGLYDRASDPATTVEMIEEKTAQLNQLNKESLVIVADAIELRGMKAKKKDDIAAAIRQRIRERKGATQRAGLIDRPSPPGIPSGDAAGQIRPMTSSTLD